VHSPSSPSPDWAAEALARVALPVALTGLTTAVGFASLGLSRLMAVREFGALAVLGVATSLLVSFIYAPAMLQELRAAKRRRPEGGGRLDRFAGRLAAFDITNRHAILAGGAALALASLAGTFQLTVGTDVLTNLPRESEVRGRISSLMTHFERASSFSIVVQADRPDAFRDPETLRQLQQLQVWLEARPEVSQTASLADTLMWINSALHGNDAAYFAVPDSRALVSQLLFFAGGEDLLGFVDAPYQQARVAVDSTLRDSGELATLLEQIEPRLAELPAGLTATVTGDSVLGSRTLNEVARAYFGLLGLTGITLNATTGLVACMVLGIAVDDTIHFLVRFNEAARALANERCGAIEALRRVVRPVTITTAALCAGLSALAFSELQNQVEFGALAAATLALAWLVDVVLTPALTSRLRIVTLWDVLTLDLGHDPRHSIPIFRGMSLRQARVVALMTRVRNFEPGHLLLRQGETGDQIYALINGEAEVSVTAGGRRVSLGILARGDVAGEVALFGGRLQADVRTRSSVRALEFTEGDLDEHLLRRYPRIGARFYQNLSDVIAQRLTPLDHEQRMRLMRLVCSFAWADRVVQPEEKSFIARLILRLELGPDERRQVEAWLEKPPSVEHFDSERVPHQHRVLFVESVAALLLADGDLAPEELEVFRPLIS
jgi:CRP-like cAMP-binding protein